VIAGVILLAQFPQFYNQYLQLLSGHRAELVYQVDQMQDAAKASNKSLTEWIRKFTLNADKEIAQQGSIMQKLIERLEGFTQAEKAFSQASLFTKPFLFIRHADTDILRDTFAQFKWGFNFTIETLAYALIGFLLGLLVFQLLRSFFLFLGASLLGRRKAPPIS
jgi:hypothetical protein